jgi:glycosyltransferase involved in cell wall biosynthesis
MKILYVTTISLTMNTFFIPHLEMLVGEGHQVDIACNCDDLAINERFDNLGCHTYQVDFSRSPLSLGNVRAYKQLKNIIENGNYDVVHCHTPNASMIARLACRKLKRKNQLQVFYTAHGFHFYSGAPMLNWLLFYPVEKLCSYFTDKLITINGEDFALAKEKMHAKEVLCIPGVGVDLSVFENIQENRKEKRKDIGVPEDALMLFSVGELNDNKNHQVVIKALSKMNNANIHYVIAGVGDKENQLRALANELGLKDQLHLLGFRKDIPQLNAIADLFCFPSFREGLSVSLMEAMGCGLPVVCSSIRGNVDLIDENGGALFEPSDIDDCVRAISTVIEGNRQIMGQYNKEKIKQFSLPFVLEQVKQLYCDSQKQ